MQTWWANQNWDAWGFFFSNVICIASHMLWLRFIPPSIALTCWFALWPVRHLSPQTPKVLKEMLNTNLESGFNWRCWIEKYRTRAICSNACSLWESKLNCENNGSTDQILVLPSSPIGVRQCHVMAWSFSSFPPKPAARWAICWVEVQSANTYSNALLSHMKYTLAIAINA